MSLVFEEEIINGVAQDTIHIKEDGAQLFIILKNSITDFDIVHLTKVSEKVGADMEAKLPLYTMPNGQTADVYYAPFIKEKGAYEAVLQNVNTSAKFNVINSRLDTVEASVADHETRITTLEP